MVQRQNPLQQGDFYQREGTWTRPDRSTSFLEIPQENRYVPAPTPTLVHARSQTIGEALKECVGIPVKAYALVVRLENDEDKFYSSASLTEYRDRIFTEQFKQNFRRSVRKTTASDNPYANSAFSHDGLFNELDADASSSGGYTRKHSSSGGSSSDAKKRRYPNYRNRNGSNDDTPMPVQVRKTQQLRIGDSAEVEQFYTTRFKDMQQSSCKVMGKAFVKLVEPKKQTHHPYTKGDEKAPPWWPNTTGENSVRHKEPDHLLKPERIRLLVHILRMIVKPAKDQDPTVQKLGLNVQKLEEVTMEQMNIWFNDKEHPENAQKRPFLKEIFKIARAEERYLNGEIDGSTYFSVMYGERSSTEDSDYESEMKPEGDEDEIPTSAVSVSMSSPDSMVSPTSGHNSHLLDTDMRTRLPMRQSAHVQMDESQYNDNTRYYNSRGMGFHPQSPNVQDRQSFVTTPSYPSPQSNMYNNWSMVTNAPQQAYYTTSPQQSLPPSTGTYLPPPISQQHMLPPPPPTFDSLPLGGGRYDTSPALGNSLRTGSMSHPHQHHPVHNQNQQHSHHIPATTFDSFLHDGNAFQQQHESELKDEHGQGQGHLHHNG